MLTKLIIREVNDMSKSVALSQQAMSIWGKLSHDGGHNWLPLWIHLADTAEIASLLWTHWVPAHTKKIIVEGMELNDGTNKNHTEDNGEKILRLLAASHDIGKASPGFVMKANKVGFSDVVDKISSLGLPVKLKTSAVIKNIPHAHISEWVLEQYGMDRSLANIVGAHHGTPPNSVNDLSIVQEYKSQTGVGQEEWDAVHSELINYALDISGLEELPTVKLSVVAQVLINALIIMADWLASDEEHFPLISWDFGVTEHISSIERANEAWLQLNLPEHGLFSDDCTWDELYKIRFNRIPRPVQANALEMAVLCDNPGLMIIEAPMGEGKTEAALAVAEVWAKKFGLSGIYFALPTQATSDGIFPRITKWIEQLHPKSKRTIFLAHGKAGFNKEYAGIRLKSHIYDEESEKENESPQGNVTVNSWTSGRKKGLLADFVVGTVDHILMGGLKSKHLSLRHLGLANKVIVIDECHAYDAYMNQYLDLVLKWLGAYHVPVVLLSATLPPQRRRELLKVYKEAKRSKKKGSLLPDFNTESKRTEENSNHVAEAGEISPYPLISFSNTSTDRIDVPEASGKTLHVEVSMLDDEMLVEKLLELLSDGGCAGIIRNTVKDAQQTARNMEMIFGPDNVIVLHSRFLSVARVQKEAKLRRLLGPGEDQRPDKLIVVGTQVMEQSLDVDFDVLFTDICPMDLLLQRMGRLHRHNRLKHRPEKLRQAACYIMGVKEKLAFSEGSTAVYGEYLLLKTKAQLSNKIVIPQDIPNLVQWVYEEKTDEEVRNILETEKSQENVEKIFTQAKQEYINVKKNKQNRARDFQINAPENQRGSLIGWLEAKQNDSSGKRGEATVRDSTNSLEVLVVYKKSDGELYTVPWLEDYGDVRIEDVQDDLLTKAIAGCSISLPSSLVSGWNKIDEVIKELENVVIEYHLDRWYVSHWLKGELFLVLDENMETKLLDKHIVYDEKYGLWFYEEGE